MSTWSSTFQQTIDNIVVLYRNTTGRENPSLREKQLMDQAVNEALQKISWHKYGSRLRFLETDISVTTTSGTDYVDLDVDTLYIISGTVIMDAEDRILMEATPEIKQRWDAGTDFSGRPEWYGFEASSSGANYIRMKLWPTPDDTYTITMKGNKIISEDGITEIPNYMHGPLLDMATYIAMKRIGFGNPGLYKSEAEEAIQDISSQEASDGPIHIPRGAGYVYAQRLQARSNSAT